MIVVRRRRFGAAENHAAPEPDLTVTKILRKMIGAAVCICCGILAATQAQAQAPALPGVIGVEHGANAPAQRAKHYVILVSLDGFRYDYAAKFRAPNLEHLAAEGASAPEGMIPSFPSVTFPNHYTIVTGLYPEHHGIIANSFYDPVRKEGFASGKADTVRDGSWYGGVPLWSLAEKQGMRSACFFWPGSEAEIDGERPSYYLHYDSAFPDEQRIDQVIAWLKLPAAQRPHFITLYYYEPDHTGHEAGPDGPQTGNAVHHVDALMGTLTADLKMVDLPVDLIVLSDHGMATVEGDWIDLDRYADLSKFVTVGSLLYAPNEEAAERAYRQLRGASDKFVVYRRRDVPAYLHFNSNARIGDPVVIPTGPYLIRAHAPENPAAPPKGEHGYDPSKMKSMRAIFYAEGPDIRAGYKLQPFENIDVYPLIAHILGLHIGRIDGKLEPLRPILREGGSGSGEN
jgi:predicted AlkP superfamily pyrophosphatase or phosphodiesterase